MALPIDPASAASLQDSISGIKDKIAEKAESSPTSAGADFGSMLKDLASNVIDSEHTADKAVNDFAQGKQLDLHDTLLAMEKSDVSLKFAVSVRNKLLDAYREVMRMGS
jgi:flagellar hook-basal body complex protein FliE